MTISTEPLEDPTPERVVLLDESATPIGSADKYEVHNESTPLHLAFSCYVLNDSGQLLVTRRALTKLTWAGVWTNSVCGHPAPGEATASAISRRAAEELGTEVRDIRVVVPDFRYRAVDASGVVENEVCPVHVARIAGRLHPNPSEVCDWEWVDVPALIESTRLTPFAFSPWMVRQLGQFDLAHHAESARSQRRGSEAP